MARLARIVVPGLPHHVTQRRNRRQKIFVADGDYALYRDLLADRCREAGVAVWAYFLSRVEAKLGRSLRPGKRGRPKQSGKGE